MKLLRFKLSKMIVEWHFEKKIEPNQSRLLSFEMCFKVIYEWKWAVSSENTIEYRRTVM